VVGVVEVGVVNAPVVGPVVVEGGGVPTWIVIASPPWSPCPSVTPRSIVQLPALAKVTVGFGPVELSGVPSWKDH
jgi:hypothetical protein